MKRTILKSVVTVFAVWCSLTAYAYDVCVDGIFYNLDINNKTAEVTYEAKDGVSYYKGDIVIPESFLFGGITFSVTGIGENAFCKMYGDDYSLWFYDNTDLTSVSIPYSVTSIGYGAFADCTSLTNVYCYAKNVPETNSYTFININIGNATLHVPAASLESYQTTSPWSDFGTIVSLPTYRLTYMIDGVVYQSYAIEEGRANQGTLHLLGLERDTCHDAQPRCDDNR